MTDISAAAVRLSLETARTLAVVKQGLHRRPQASGTPRETLLDAIRRIGLLQLDSVNVVARSHYLVMLSRAGPYDCADLDALLYPDRKLFEQWAHAACLIPIEHLPYFLPVIEARRASFVYGDWSYRTLGEDPQATLDGVLAEVRKRGPLASSDFEDPRGRRGTWWDWKPAKAALEVLFDWGYLTVSRRTNFKRYYDLAERVLPLNPDGPEWTLHDWRRWATLKSVAHLGVATPAQASDYYRQKKTAVRAVLEELASEGALVSALVEGWQETAYLSPADLPLVDEIERGAHRPTLTAFLSPFDNLIWDRARVRDLFGFAYTIELYTPPAKRQYGYYVMPILHHGRLVGRLDPKADRQSGTLIVRALYLEPGEPVTNELVSGLAGALREFMAFHGAEDLRFERSQPDELRRAVLARIAA